MDTKSNVSILRLSNTEYHNSSVFPTSTLALHFPSDDLSTGAIVAIVIASICGSAVLICLCAQCCDVGTLLHVQRELDNIDRQVEELRRVMMSPELAEAGGNEKAVAELSEQEGPAELSEQEGPAEMSGQERRAEMGEQGRPSGSEWARQTGKVE